MSTTDIVAWWGAIVATAVLVWDVWKWKSTGPKLHVLTRMNVGYPDGRVIRTERTETGGVVTQLADYCHIELLNTGDRPTTVISIEATHQPGISLGQLVCSAARFQHHGRALPTLLGPGEMWSSRIEMGDLFALSKRGMPVLRVRASHLAREMEVLVKLPPIQETDVEPGNG